MRAEINLDISSLSERHHTGVCNVAKHLGRELLGDTSVEPGFWMNRQRLPLPLVEALLKLDGAPHLRWLAGRLTEAPGCFDPDRRSFGVFPSHKWHRRLFDHETLIVHDLTSVITPEYHTKANITWENGRLLPDMLTSDALVCVSESTRRDVRDYFPQVRHIPVEVAHLAPCCADPATIERVRAPPYVLVLGTLEPRKNVRAVLEMLATDPTWLDRYAFVFVGRWGWGESLQDIVASHGLDEAVARDRLQFPGFVADAVRDALVAHAACVIYPSRYEGFGLPVLEALALGAPVVTGRGSSLSEAGGDLAIYVDTDSPAALSAAVSSACADNSVEAIARRQAWAGQFSWWKTYERIRDLTLASASAPGARH